MIRFRLIAPLVAFCLFAGGHSLPFAPDFAQAQVVWSLSKARGVEVVSFACRYMLRRADNRWRIAHAVALDEAEKLAQPSPRAPLLRLSQQT